MCCVFICYFKTESDHLKNTSACPFTSFVVRTDLLLQVFGRHIELRVLFSRCVRFALPTTAVETAAQTTTEIATCQQATDGKQTL